MGIDNWLARQVSRRRHPDTSGYASVGAKEFWHLFGTSPDPYGFLMSQRRAPENINSFVPGVADDMLAATMSQTAELILGQPRMGMKTSGLMIPTTLLAPGPTVVVSTKLDVAKATAMARSRMGRVLHFSPTVPDPKGLTELRWSPITGCENWSTAQSMADRLVKVGQMLDEQHKTGSDRDHHFQTRAKDLVAVLLFEAALDHHDMSWVMDRLVSLDAEAIGRLGLSLLKRGFTKPGNAAAGIFRAPDRERAGVFSTAMVALHAYNLPEAIRSAESPSFDPAAFVRGDHEAQSELMGWDGTDIGANMRSLGIHPRQLGSYDTLYITLGEAESMAAPICSALLDEIRRAAYRQHDTDELAGIHDRAPVTFILDEMFACPWPSLPTVLAEGLGRGVAVAGALQDFSQAEARYGEVGKSFPTLFNNLIVTRGIRDGATLQMLSDLVGETREAVWNQHETMMPVGWFGTYKPVWTSSVSHERVPRLPKDEIYRQTDNPSQALIFTAQGGWERINLMTYYRSDIWLAALILCAHQIVHWGQGARREFPLPPLPDIDRDGGARIADMGPRVLGLWQETKAAYLALNGDTPQPPDDPDLPGGPTIGDNPLSPTTPSNAAKERVYALCTRRHCCNTGSRVSCRTRPRSPCDSCLRTDRRDRSRTLRGGRVRARH